MTIRKQEKVITFQGKKETHTLSCRAIMSTKRKLHRNGSESACKMEDFLRQSKVTESFNGICTKSQSYLTYCQLTLRARHS